jgi:hypothetical protein
VVFAVPLHKKLRFGSTTDGYLMQTGNDIKVLNASNFSLFDFTQNYLQHNDSLSIKFLNSAQQFSQKAFLSWRTDDWDFRFGATYLNLTLNNEDQTHTITVNKNYNLVLPFISYTNWRRTFGYLRSTIEKTVEFPSFVHLLPIQDLTNPWMRLIGNPYLVPFEQWHGGLVFNKQNYHRFKNIWLNMDANQSDNYLCYMNTTNAQGISYRTPINLAGYFSETSGNNFKISISKKWDVGMWISENYSITPEIFNQQKNYGKSFAFSFFPSLSLSGSDKLDIDFGTGAAYSEYKNNLNAAVNYSQLLPSLTHSIRWNCWKGAELNYDLNIEDKRNIPSIGKVVTLFNIFYQQALDKSEKLNLKLSCYDLFKQNVTITRSVNGSFVNTSQSNLLQRFFMISFIYKMKGKSSEGGGATF